VAVEVKKPPAYDHVLGESNPGRKELHGKRCRVLGHGSTHHSVLLEFEDGRRVIASAKAAIEAK